MIGNTPAPAPQGRSLPIYLGIATESGAPYWLLSEALRRGVHLRGAIGAGKTSLIRRLLLGRGMGAPFAQFDYIGTGHRELQAVVATVATALAVAEDRCPQLVGSAAAFLRRYGFLAVGAPNPAVQIDLLRRRHLPHGRIERVRDVTSRAIEVLLVKLNDADVAQRVRFLRIATALVCVLVAADRPIADGLTFLNDPQFASFLDRELEARTFRPSERVFLQYQRAELQRILSLRPEDVRKSWRAFDEETGSTRNSLNDFLPGSVLGDLFNDETFPLEAVAFGDACLSVTNREPEDLQRAKAYQAVHAMLHALCLHRQDVAGVPPLAVVIDEPWWVRRNIPGILAVARNLGVSYWVSHQSDAQWEDIGLRTMGMQLRALTNLQITFRPDSFLDAKDEVLHARTIAPDGLVQRFWASSYGDSDQAASAITRSWGNVFQYAEDGLLRGTAGSCGRAETSSSSSGSNAGAHEVLNVVSFMDQVHYLAQAALRRRAFTGMVRVDGHATEVAFAPPAEFPRTLFGVPIADLFRTFHDAAWRARRVPRTPYDPTILLERASAPAPAVKRAAQDAVLPEAAAPPSAEPAPPPTFDLPRREPAKRAAKRRRPRKRQV